MDRYINSFALVLMTDLRVQRSNTMSRMIISTTNESESESKNEVHFFFVLILLTDKLLSKMSIVSMNLLSIKKEKKKHTLKSV